MDRRTSKRVWLAHTSSYTLSRERWRTHVSGTRGEEELGNGTAIYWLSLGPRSRDRFFLLIFSFSFFSPVFFFFSIMLSHKNGALTNSTCARAVFLLSHRLSFLPSFPRPDVPRRARQRSPARRTLGLSFSRAFFPCDRSSALGEPLSPSI